MAKRMFEGVSIVDEEEDVLYKRARVDTVVKSCTKCIKTCGTDDLHPGALSPFRPEHVETVSFPRKKEDEDDITARKFYEMFVARTPEQCAEEMAAPQRSMEWKEARKFSLTASDFGSAAGSNPHCKPEDLVKKKLWETFVGNQATKWGSKMEEKASAAFLAYAQETYGPEARLHEFGLLKHSDMSWMAVSPDGVLEWKEGEKTHYALVEFKCPTRIETEEHPYAKYPRDTPPYYRDQMLGIWGYLNAHGGIVIDGEAHRLEKAFFVVWQPRHMWVTEHYFVEEDWSELLVSLRKWYFGKFLPAMVWNYNLRLEHGETAPSTAPILLDSFAENTS